MHIQRGGRFVDFTFGCGGRGAARCIGGDVAAPRGGSGRSGDDGGCGGGGCKAGEGGIAGAGAFAPLLPVPASTTPSRKRLSPLAWLDPS